MPFRVERFQHVCEKHLDGEVKDRLLQASEAFDTLTTRSQKARLIHGLMDVLDAETEKGVREQLMEECGRTCIGRTTLERASKLQLTSTGMDDLLEKLNQAHIGGGHLHREGDAIQASYDRCYCGSVGGNTEPFSSTYCHCSCGWYRQLFEHLLGRQVEVELLDSIVQGAQSCRFVIRI